MTVHCMLCMNSAPYHFHQKCCLWICLLWPTAEWKGWHRLEFTAATSSHPGLVNPSHVHAGQPIDWTDSLGNQSLDRKGLAAGPLTWASMLITSHLWIASITRSLVLSSDFRRRLSIKQNKNKKKTLQWFCWMKILFKLFNETQWKGRRKGRSPLFCLLVFYSSAD